MVPFICQLIGGVGLGYEAHLKLQVSVVAKKHSLQLPRTSQATRPRVAQARERGRFCRTQLFTAPVGLIGLPEHLIPFGLAFSSPTPFKPSLMVSINDPFHSLFYPVFV